MIYKPFDIVTVPFPFTDSHQSKRRPAVILSSHDYFGEDIGHSVMAMITSARNNPWPLDVSISNLKKAGLPKPSVIRLKFFTLDHRIIIETIGSLASKDQRSLRENIQSLFGEILDL